MCCDNPLSTRNEINQIATLIKSIWSEISTDRSGRWNNVITRPKTSPIHRREKPVAVKNKRSAKKIMKSKQDEKLSRKRINPIGVRSKKKPNLDLILSSLSYFLTDMEHRQRANPPSSRRDQGGGRKGALYRIMSQFPGGRGEGWRSRTSSFRSIPREPDAGVPSTNSAYIAGTPAIDRRIAPAFSYP